MEQFDHLLEWDELALRVRGAKVQQIVTELLREKQLPVSEVRLEFLEGELQVSARIQKWLSIPVRLTVQTIKVVGKTQLLVLLDNVATFAMLPIPTLLFRLIGTRGLPDGITFDVETLTVTVSLERFLPPFVELTIESIRIVHGGVAVNLGRGGAGLPTGDWRR